ncbi:MAG TPA: hypothetical protein VKR24_02225 [Candidatus Limnocylindrales bacterium]|nr:hypothetical protein [Candidatus Limnocylindrales bacterium]
MTRIRRAIARARQRTALATRRYRADGIAIAGIGSLAVGVGMISPVLPWLLVGGYLVLVASSIAKPPTRS